MRCVCQRLAHQTCSLSIAHFRSKNESLAGYEPCTYEEKYSSLNIVIYCNILIYVIYIVPNWAPFILIVMNVYPIGHHSHKSTDVFNPSPSDEAQHFLPILWLKQSLQISSPHFDESQINSWSAKEYLEKFGKNIDHLRSQKKYWIDHDRSGVPSEFFRWQKRSINFQDHPIFATAPPDRLPAGELFPVTMWRNAERTSPVRRKCVVFNGN